MQNNQLFKIALRIAAGGYLLYTAWKLVPDSGQEGAILAAVVLFAVAGAVLLVMGVIKVKQIADEAEKARLEKDIPPEWEDEDA